MADVVNLDQRRISDLNDVAAERLAHLERRVESGFLEIGTALLAIRNERLYTLKHSTFAEYCQERWGKGRSTVYRMLQGAEVMENLSPIRDKPKNLEQTRPLFGLLPEQQVEVWKESVATAPGGKPTAAHVRSVVSRIKPVAGVAAPATAQGPRGAFLCAKLAMVHMSQIQPDDPKKLEAGMILLEWIISDIFGGFEAYQGYVHSPEARKAARRRTN